eukprot:PhM_4_TR16613/c0_g2_i1/m.56569
MISEVSLVLRDTPYPVGGIVIFDSVVFASLRTDSCLLKTDLISGLDQGPFGVCNPPTTAIFSLDPFSAGDVPPTLSLDLVSKAMFIGTGNTTAPRMVKYSFKKDKLDVFIGTGKPGVDNGPGPMDRTTFSAFSFVSAARVSQETVVVVASSASSIISVDDFAYDTPTSTLTVSATSGTRTENTSPSLPTVTTTATATTTVSFNSETLSWTTSLSSESSISSSSSSS